jgi:hypothetical protein
VQEFEMRGPLFEQFTVGHARPPRFDRSVPRSARTRPIANDATGERVPHEWLLGQPLTRQRRLVLAAQAEAVM